MQGSLLAMCVLWTYRQRRLGIDEFGNPLVVSTAAVGEEAEDDEAIPSLVRGNEDATKFTVPPEIALESAVQGDATHMVEAEEETPLLPVAARKSGAVRAVGGRLSWLMRW